MSLDAGEVKVKPCFTIRGAPRKKRLLPFLPSIADSTLVSLLRISHVPHITPIQSRIL